MLILWGKIGLPPHIIKTAKTYSTGTEKKSKENLYRRDYISDRSRFGTILLDKDPML